MSLSPDEVIDLCWRNLPRATNLRDQTNVRIAARLAWEEKELGGIEHVQFAYRNGTPIVPPGDCCHPVELVKRGYIDGQGWPAKPKDTLGRVNYFKWPDGAHWYASIDGVDITDGRKVKFDSQPEAERAAKRFIEAQGISRP